MIRVENRPTGEVLPWGIWVPNGSPVLPERRLLVPEPAIKFDKLTPEQMGLAHGRIAERPPLAILDRLISRDRDTGRKYIDRHVNRDLDFIREKWDIEGEHTPEEERQGIAYAAGYSEGLLQFFKEHGVSPDQVERRYSPHLLSRPESMDLFLDGHERIPAVSWLSGYSSSYFPREYQLGFMVGVVRDFGFTPEHVPSSSTEYNLFLEGLSGVEEPSQFDSMFGQRSGLKAFQLGSRIHEIVEAEPLHQAA